MCICVYIYIYIYTYNHDALLNLLCRCLELSVQQRSKLDLRPGESIRVRLPVQCTVYTQVMLYETYMIRTGWGGGPGGGECVCGSMLEQHTNNTHIYIYINLISLIAAWDDFKFLQYFYFFYHHCSQHHCLKNFFSNQAWNDKAFLNKTIQHNYNVCNSFDA